MKSNIRQDFEFYKRQMKIESSLKAFLLLFFFNLGFQLILSIRIQRMLVQIPFIGVFLRRILWYFTSILTSTEISFLATFGPGVYFPHTTGVVIGDTWDIGSSVTIMQGVTLGRKHSRVDPSKRSRIGDDVMLSCGAKVIGELEIGNGAIIGANAVVLNSIPPGAVAVGVPAKVIQRES